jgi:hypothetical protein
MCASLRTVMSFFLMLTLAQANTAQTAVNFEYYQSLIFLKVKINSNRANFTFLLNTSANTSVIDKKLAGILKLPSTNKVDSVEGTAGMEEVSFCKITALQAGGATVKNIEITCRDLSGSGTYSGQKIDGILGTDFLKNFAIAIDFKNQTIAFVSNKLKTKQRSIPFEISNGIPKLEARFNDTFTTALHYNSALSMTPSRFIYVNISYPQWCDMKKTCRFMNHAGYVNGKGVGGDIYLEIVKVRSMLLDTIDIRNAYVVIQPKEGYFKRDEAIGFFGNNLLEKYNKVILDFPNNRIVFGDLKKQPAVRHRRGSVFSKLALGL